MSTPTPEPGVEVEAAAGAPWWPAPRHVEALMSARFGPEGITETSSPTVEQVADLIAQLATTVVAECDEPGEGQAALARATVALGVASYIENSSYPEQVDLTSSPAEFYRRRYAEHVNLLRAAIVTDTRARVPTLAALYPLPPAAAPPPPPPAVPLP